MNEGLRSRLKNGENQDFVVSKELRTEDEGCWDLELVKTKSQKLMKGEIWSCLK